MVLFRDAVRGRGFLRQVIRRDVRGVSVMKSATQRDMPRICTTCRGREFIEELGRHGWTNQCRKSVEFRAAQGVPDVCPYGLAFENRPIGNNPPSGRMGAPDAPSRSWAACAWGKLMSCCRVRCEHSAARALMKEGIWPKQHCTPDHCRHFAPAT